MTMLLSDTRLRVYQILDDDGTASTDGARWARSEVDQKVRTAIEFCATLYASKGGTRLDELVDLTTDSDGYGNLLSIKPLHIRSVRMNLGGSFVPLNPVISRDFHQKVSSPVALKIRLVRSPTLPTLATDPVLYGPNLSFESMDELICLKAARMLLTKDRERDASIEAQFEETLQGILSAENQIQCFDMPSGTGHCTVPYVYDFVPYAIYLGIKR